MTPRPNGLPLTRSKWVKVPRWLKLSLQQAGFSNPARVLALGAMAPLITAAVVQDLIGVWILSLACGLALLGLEIEMLFAKARKRSNQIELEWPSVIESLRSAAQSAMSILDSLRDIADSKHLIVARDFAHLCDATDRGLRLDSALEQLKSRFAIAVCDSTIETLRLVNESGGNGFISALDQQAQAVRERTTVIGQIRAKQAWVIGTAKMAVIAPWLVVAMLSLRPENASAYNSAEGSAILLLGLIASSVALKLIEKIAHLETNLRVLA